MAIYKRSEADIELRLSGLLPDARAELRLHIDIVDILTGPTSSRKADTLAQGLIDVNGAEDVAQAMLDAAERFFRTRGGSRG